MENPYSEDSFEKSSKMNADAFYKLLTKYIDRTGFQYAYIPLIQKAVYSLKKIVAHQP